jgi:WD40 repeat protein
MIFSLVQDFAAILDAMPPEHPRRRILALLDEAIRRDMHFIDRHPTTLFQCLWNSCWWYDCPEAAGHHEQPVDGLQTEKAPWEMAGEKLSTCVERWRSAKERSVPRFFWLRSLRPPSISLASGLRGVLEAGRDPIARLCLSASGNRLAIGSWRGVVRVWDIDSGMLLADLNQYGTILGLALSADGTWGVSGSENGSVHIWETATGTVLRQFREERSVKAVSILHGDRVVRIVSNRDYSKPSAIYILDLQTSDDGLPWKWRTVAERKWEFGESMDVLDPVVFSPDGQRIAVGSRSVAIWDAASGAQIASWPVEGGRATALAFCRRGEQLVCGCEDGSVRVWDVGDNRTMTPAIRHQSRILGLAVSAEGAVLAISSRDAASLWNMGGDNSVRQVPVPLSEAVQSLALSSDGELLVTGLVSGLVRLWRTPEIKRFIRLRGHDGPLSGIRFSTDGSRVATASDDGTVRLWFSTTGHQERCFSGHESGVTSVAFSANSRLIASGSRDHTVRVWDSRTGQQLACLNGHQRSVSCVASGSADRTIKLWRLRPIGLLGRLWEWLRARIGVESDAESRTISIGNMVFSLAISPDGRWFAAGGERCLIRGNLHRDTNLRKTTHSPYIDSCLTRLSISADCSLIAGWDSTGAFADGFIYLTRSWQDEQLTWFEGQYDVAAVTKDPFGLSRHAVVIGSETVIQRRDKPDFHSATVTLAYFPSRLEHITSHTHEPVWAGSVGSYLCLLALEGDPDARLAPAGCP